MAELGLRCCCEVDSKRWITIRVEVEAVELLAIYERLKREEQAKEKNQGGIGVHRRVRVAYEQEEDDDADKRARVAARQGEERGETACGSGRMGRPIARPTAERRKTLAGFGPTKKRSRGWAKEKRRETDFRPETKKNIISISFFLFLVLQIHFQMIFEIIFF
jgi:hypothetical protein